MESLLYRACRDGWGLQNLHSHCDNKGPTVVWLKPMIVSLVDTRTNTGNQVTMVTKDLYIGFSI